MSKKEFYKNSIEKINKNTTTKELWRLVKKLDGKEESIREENIIHNNEESARELLRKTYGKNEKIDIESINIPEFINENKLIDEEEWEKILNKKKKSAPGVDKITYEMLKNIHPGTSKIIRDEINEMWEKGKIKKRAKKNKNYSHTKTKQGQNKGRKL